MAKGLTFPIKKVEGLYYPGSENKPADQLHGYIAADLCLFLHMQKAGFLMTPLIINMLEFLKNLYCRTLPGHGSLLQ